MAAAEKFVAAAARPGEGKAGGRVGWAHAWDKEADGTAAADPTASGKFSKKAQASAAAGTRTGRVRRARYSFPSNR